MSDCCLQDKVDPSFTVVVKSVHPQQQQQQTSPLDTDGSLPDTDNASRLELDADDVHSAEHEQTLISLKEQLAENVTLDESGKEPLSSNSSIHLTQTDNSAIPSGENKAKLDLTEKQNDTGLEDQSVVKVSSDVVGKEAFSSNNSIQLAETDTDDLPSGEKKAKLDLTETRNDIGLTEQPAAKVTSDESDTVALSEATSTLLVKTGSGTSPTAGVEEKAKLESGVETAQGRYLRAVKKERKRKKTQALRLVEDICR